MPQKGYARRVDIMGKSHGTKVTIASLMLAV
jgi:hypothetical protein